MSGNVLVVLDKQSKVGAGSTIAMNGDSIGGFSVSVSGAGNVSARVRLEIANDPGGPWVSDAASIVSLSGICSATTYLRSTTHFEYIRAVVESISAGASVSVFFGDFASSGTGFYQQDNLVFGETNPLTGGIKHIVDPVNGGGAFNFSGDRNLASSNVEFLPTSVLTNWTAEKSAALTVEVDNTVTFNGNPSIKVTIPAGTSGNLQIGTSIANALIPYGWDKSDFAVAVKYVGFTGYDWVSTFPPTITAYLGDSSMTNFFVVGKGPEHFPELKPQEGEWFIAKPSITDFATGGGTPSIAAAMRAKLRWIQVSQGTPSYIYIGLLGKMPRRKKATVVLTLDDGYASWYSFVRPLLKNYGIPVSMGIQKIYANQPGFMTDAQIIDLYNDQSCLFDVVNHAKRNVSYATLGAAGYYAELDENRQYLRSIGIGGDGPNHHPYVQTLWGNDLVSLMRAGGYLSARSGLSTTYSHGRDGALAAGEDKLQYSIRSRMGLTAGTTLSTATALIDTAITNKELCFIMGHDFADTAATDVWAYTDFVQLIGYIASKIDAGLLEVKSWTRWFADLKGMTTDRR